MTLIALQMMNIVRVWLWRLVKHQAFSDLVTDENLRHTVIHQQGETYSALPAFGEGNWSQANNVELQIFLCPYPEPVLNKHNHNFFGGLFTPQLRFRNVRWMSNDISHKQWM